MLVSYLSFANSNLLRISGMNIAIPLAMLKSPNISAQQVAKYFKKGGLSRGKLCSAKREKKELLEIKY
jgi:hypothetical protein